MICIWFIIDFFMIFFMSFLIGGGVKKFMVKYIFVDGSFVKINIKLCFFCVKWYK